MEQTSNGNRFLSWGIFIVIVILIVWGLIAAQNKANKAEANLVLPDQIVATDHIRGNASAPATLVEYGDFQCPACGLYFPIVEETYQALGPEKVRMVFRNFPLPQHGNAIPAAKAAEAAAIQNKYWEMYELLYKNQKDWENSTDPNAVFTGYAKNLGLDLVKFNADYSSDAVAAKIDTDYKGGVKAGINATPTFFINGQKITSPANVDEFKKLLNDATTTPAV
jgi:protein-disulfide isomerase